MGNSGELDEAPPQSQFNKVGEAQEEKKIWVDRNLGHELSDEEVDDAQEEGVDGLETLDGAVFKGENVVDVN